MKRTIAIVGNPNCGKTTLFNAFTGSNQRIGNWPGVTVEKKEGSLKHANDDYLVVDLPGIYSLSAHSEDERVARDYIVSGEADLIINIVDAVNLERNLYLTTQLREMNVPMIVLLNRSDLAAKKKIKIETDHLAQHLGCPVIPISAIKSTDVSKAVAHIADAIKYEQNKHFHITYDDHLEKVLNRIMKNISTGKLTSVNARWLALQCAEGDTSPTLRTGIQQLDGFNDAVSALADMEKSAGESPEILLADGRYAFVHGIARDVILAKGESDKLTEKIDSIVLNRFLGIPIFLAVMYLLFWGTVSFGSAFIDFFDIAAGTIFVDGSAHLLNWLGSPDWLIAILSGGVGAGIQSVATFIPVIFTMFFMLSILEDSGYMSRAAFVMDRFMRRIGLPGKAFVPMIVGFGCSVPAVMGSRTLESKKDRFLTVFMTPFMSCGAKLPVYALFAAAFFPHNAGALVFSLYIAGVLLAIITGLVLKKTLFRGESSHFIMELPMYNAPRLSSILIHTWNRLKLFMLRASQVIIIAVTLVSFLNSVGTDGTFGNENTEKSVLSVVGKKITPVFEPMGVEPQNWPASVCIFTGLFAKEAVVGTLSALYSQNESAAAETPEAEGAPEKDDFSVIAGLKEAVATVPENLSGVIGAFADPLGTGMLEESENAETIAEEIDVDKSLFSTLKQFFTPTQAYAYLLFILLYFPCVALLGAIFRETGLKMAIFQSLYMTVFAWVTATLFYQIVAGLSLGWIAVAAGTLAALGILLYILGRLDFANVGKE